MYGSDPMGLLSWRFLVDQAGHGVSTDILSHSVDLGHYLVGGIAKVVGTGETFIKQRPLPDRRWHALRPRQARRPNRRGHQRGLHRHDVHVRERGTRHVRGLPLDGRSREPEQLRGLRHQGFRRLELRDDERVARLHRGRAQAHRVHHGVRRRSLPPARQLRSRQCEQHRVRGPDLHRGSRVPAIRRCRPPVHAGLHRGPGVRVGAGRGDAQLEERSLGRRRLI